MPSERTVRRFGCLLALLALPLVCLVTWRSPVRAWREWRREWER